MPVLSGGLAAALNHKVINEAFEIARTNRTGILGVVGFGAPVQAYDGYKMGWLDAQVSAQGDTVNGAVTNSATSITVDDGSKFRVGMLVSAEGSDEVIQVTAVAGNVLTVVRGIGGTTAAAIADNAKLIVDSTSREENSLGQDDGIYQPESVENFFQTMDTMITMSRRALATLQYGNTNNLAFQVSERLRQLTTQMDRALVRGRRLQNTIGGDSYTYAGGMKFYLDQAGAIKTDGGGAALTLDAINALNEQIVMAGGMTNTLAVSVAKAREIQALVAANYNSQRLADWSADEGSVLALPSDIPLVGSVNQIVIDSNLHDTELMIFDRNKISVAPMAAGNASDSGAWRTMDATQNGQDGESVRIVGDFSFEIRQSKVDMAWLHNLA